jgi:hypothetical protein
MMLNANWSRLAPFFLATWLYPSLCSAEIILGDPPTAPLSVAGLPGGGPKPQIATGGFYVDTSSREQVRSFYRAIYPASDGAPMNSTADVTTCTPGTNSAAFQDAVARRINWFRAMAGLPAAVTLDSGNSAKSQQAAVIMSRNGLLSHYPPPSWLCYSGPGADAASNSNIALGADGADSISSYMLDYGTNNFEVGHRRWLLYPQTQVMGTGDVPPVGNSYMAANSTWVFDANFYGPRPALRTPCIAWPPSGYVPYQTVYPRWSFSLTNSDFTSATVTMTSNGVNIAVSQENYAINYGENTVVWVPMGLNPNNYFTVFPFNGTDTVYGVTVSNIRVGASYISFSYNVTLFDPAVPGPDYVPPVVVGPDQPGVGYSNSYYCRSPTAPAISSYQFRVTPRASGNLADNAQNGLTNFSISPTPIYPIITNAADGLGNRFHLAHADIYHADPQLLQLKETLFPATNTQVSFDSRLGWASGNEAAHVQASADGGTSWADLFIQYGLGPSVPGETTFTRRSVSLSNYVGRPTLLRFNYDAQTSIVPGTDPAWGWTFKNIVITNTEQLLTPITNSTSSTYFAFTPAQLGGYNLEARALIFTDFPLDWGPIKQVTAVPGILMSSPVFASGQVQLNFTIAPSTTGVFKLLQVDELGASWSTNSSAVFTTNVPGTSYRFATAPGPAARYYKVIKVGS